MDYNRARAYCADSWWGLVWQFSSVISPFSTWTEILSRRAFKSKMTNQPTRALLCLPGEIHVSKQ